MRGAICVQPIQGPVVYSTKAAKHVLGIRIPLSVVLPFQSRSFQAQRRSSSTVHTPLARAFLCRSRSVAFQLFTQFPWEFPSAPPTSSRADMDMRVACVNVSDGPPSMANTGSYCGGVFVLSLSEKTTRKEARYSLVVTQRKIL